MCAPQAALSPDSNWALSPALVPRLPTSMIGGFGVQSFAKDNHFFALPDTRYSASLTTGSQLIGHPGAQQKLGTAGWI